MDMRHGARVLKALLVSLTDTKVLYLLDELANRVQSGDSPTLSLVRGAAKRAAAEARATARRQRELVALGDGDGWMLDAERAA